MRLELRLGATFAFAIGLVSPTVSPAVRVGDCGRRGCPGAQNQQDRNQVPTITTSDRRLAARLPVAPTRYSNLYARNQRLKPHRSSGPVQRPLRPFLDLDCRPSAADCDVITWVNALLTTRSARNALTSQPPTDYDQSNTSVPSISAWFDGSGKVNDTMSPDRGCTLMKGPLTPAPGGKRVLSEAKCVSVVFSDTLL